ncbi:unnamed protein product [Adineta ricciae]|uniref:Large-conductance mechanosensitive channel n=1 Tax=Adineta ricciae TaxID=249248 RepID=A0A815Y5E0_ADIRI|nr:unnamed protein product [Adineta ricciae]
MTNVRECCCTWRKEFQEFALRGNIFDLAIGIIIGTAFQNVVKSLVDDILTPPFGLIFDGVDFSNLTIPMRNFLRKDQPPVVIRYGLFLQQIIHLFIIALILFFIMKFIKRIREAAHRQRQAENSSNEPFISPIDEKLKVLCEIRDLLQDKTNLSQRSTSNLIHL